jgi:hypothetical protein
MGVILNFNNWSKLNEDTTGEPQLIDYFPDWNNAAAYFKAASAKKMATGSFIGKYHCYWITKYNPESVNFDTYQIKVTGLGTRTFKDAMVPDFASKEDEGVYATFDPVKGLRSNTSWLDAIKKETKHFVLLSYTTPFAENAKAVNDRYQAVDLAKLQAMLANFPRIKEKMAKIKAERPDIMKLLTGNAKTVFDAATTQPITPVKKP